MKPPTSHRDVFAELELPEGPAETHPDLRIDARQPFSPPTTLEREHQRTALVVGRAIRIAMNNSREEIVAAETDRQRRQIIFRLQREVSRDLPRTALRRRSNRAAGVADEASKRQYRASTRKSEVSVKRKTEILASIETDTDAVQRRWVGNTQRGWDRSVRQQFATLQRQVAGLSPNAADATMDRLIRKRAVQSQRNVVIGAKQDVQTLSSNITRARGRRAGLKRFLWRSRRVLGVRPLHQQIDRESQRGRTFPMGRGHPKEGIPGVTPPGCLCWMVPMFT